MPDRDSRDRAVIRRCVDSLRAAYRDQFYDHKDLDDYIVSELDLTPQEIALAYAADPSRAPHTTGLAVPGETPMTRDPVAVFAPDSEERRRLNVVSELLNLFSELETEVAETYFDFGQNWRWTTVLAREKDENSAGIQFQVLSPRQQRDVVHGSMADLHAVVQDLVIAHPRA